MTNDKKRRPRIGEDLMDFFEDKKDRDNQPLDEVLTDESVLDELKDNLDEFKDEDDSPFKF